MTIRHFESENFTEKLSIAYLLGNQEQTRGSRLIY